MRDPARIPEMIKTRFRFLHRGDDGFLYWESVQPIGAGESRHEVVRCSAEWFWRNRVHGDGGELDDGE